MSKRKPPQYRIAVEFRKGMIGKGSSALMCFAVCSPLAGYLDFLGLEAEIVEGTVDNTEHYWLRLPDGQILDPTADQFTKPDGSTMPQVYLGDKPEWYREV